MPVLPTPPIGPSPRLWGTRFEHAGQAAAQRSIPTPVGNAQTFSRTSGLSAVHPHACGERVNGVTGENRLVGPSPRLWGTRAPGCGPSAQRRSIPTPVGNARAPSPSEASATVHPHACGERMMITTQLRIQRGPSPRLWGTLTGTCPARAVCRSIPTPVGNATSRRRPAALAPVHPHACGERLTPEGDCKEASGPSPRLWGTRAGFLQRLGGRRSIPTPVGNARSRLDGVAPASVHPHACGERYLQAQTSGARAGPSPRLWGTPHARRGLQGSQRSIPTPVGNAKSQRGAASRCAVHPHACGERRRTLPGGPAVIGPSPRLWGTRGRGIAGGLTGRSIPTPVGNAASRSR